MKKFLYFIIVMAIIGGGYYFYSEKNKPALAPSDELKSEENKVPAKTAQNQSEDKNSSTSTPVNNQTGTKPQGKFSNGEEGMSPDILVVQIDYDGQKFTPKEQNIKVGDIVIFKNNSGQEFWPASNPHPIHTGYSGFDAKKPIAAGGKWQFQFFQQGAWGFHDHLNPSAEGIVRVIAK